MSTEALGPAPVPTTTDAMPAGHQPVVLVVDDVRSTRDRLTRVLGAGGYAVTCARDGREALRLLTLNTAADVILLDLDMPVMNGWEFREFQLRDRRLAAIPTVVLTGRELAARERFALRIGSATLIPKPFEDWQVLDPLARIFGRLRQRGTPEHERWLSSEGQPLLWSRRGRVACERHAPARDSAEWTSEGWTWIPRYAGKSKIEYSCQQCSGGPIRHPAGVRVNPS